MPPSQAYPWQWCILSTTFVLAVCDGGALAATVATGSVPAAPQIARLVICVISIIYLTSTGAFGCDSQDARTASLAALARRLNHGHRLDCGSRVHPDYKANAAHIKRISIRVGYLRADWTNAMLGSNSQLLYISTTMRLVQYCGNPGFPDHWHGLPVVVKLSGWTSASKRVAAYLPDQLEHAV